MSYSITPLAGLGLPLAPTPAPAAQPLPHIWTAQDVGLLVLLGCATYVFTSAVLTGLGFTSDRRDRDDEDDYGVRGYPMAGGPRSGGKTPAQLAAIDAGLARWNEVSDIQAGWAERDARKQRARDAAAADKKAREAAFAAAWDRHINGLEDEIVDSDKMNRIFGAFVGPSTPRRPASGYVDYTELGDYGSPDIYDVVGQASTRRTSRWDEPDTERGIPPTDVSTQRTPSSDRFRTSKTLASPRWLPTFPSLPPHKDITTMASSLGAAADYGSAAGQYISAVNNMLGQQPGINGQVPGTSTAPTSAGGATDYWTAANQYASAVTGMSQTQGASSPQYASAVQQYLAAVAQMSGQSGAPAPTSSGVSPADYLAAAQQYASALQGGVAGSGGSIGTSFQNLFGSLFGQTGTTAGPGTVVPVPGINGQVPAIPVQVQTESPFGGYGLAIAGVVAVGVVAAVYMANKD